MRVLLVLAVAAVLNPQPPNVRITVRLLDVRTTKGGVLRVGLHSAPGPGFPGPAPLMNQTASPSGQETTLTFEAPPGTYAVAVHHDANANGKMDANFLGIPKEGYGVSNDVRTRFRPPRFSEAAVRVTRDTTLVVHLTY
jgi:uncharacterized protein (DUF2141 family)